MANLSQASIASAFLRSAAQFGVAESDYLVLNALGISTYESFALRVTSREDLEEFLRDTVTPRAAYRDQINGLVTFTRYPPVAWPVFKMTDDAAALRKLWLLAKEVCKAELERLAAGDGSSKVKVGLSGAVAMEQAAVGRGMPAPSSDADRPSLFCLTTLARSMMGPGATFEYVAWEVFINQEAERRMVRSGTLPKSKSELVLSKDAKISVEDKGTDVVPGDKANDMEKMRGYLDVRAKAAEMLSVASYTTYRSLTEKYCSKILATVPEGMRAPTIQEVRRFDRTLHEEILRWLSREVGSLDNALEYYLRDENNALWRLLDPVLQSLPDQGIEKGKASSHKADEKEAENKGSRSRSRSRRRRSPLPKGACADFAKEAMPSLQEKALAILRAAGKLPQANEGRVQSQKGCCQDHGPQAQAGAAKRWQGLGSGPVTADSGSSGEKGPTE